MSHEIVRSIVIKDQKVIFTSAPNNVSPRVYTRQEVPGYTEIYQKEGMHALLKEIAFHMWNGNYHLQPHSLIARYLDESYSALFINADLRHFLTADLAAAFIARCASKWMEDPQYNPRKDLNELNALRYDKDTVLSICENRPQAFWYAASAVSGDREAAKEYVEKCAGKLGFGFPVKFPNDKELARIALAKNGCIYRQFVQVLRENKEITKLAFDSSLDREYSEHLPSLIPEALIQDKTFMRELLSVCPEIHLNDRWNILHDPECARIWIQNGKYTISMTSGMPENYLRDPQIRQHLISRFEKEGCLQRLQDIYELKNIPFSSGEKQPLDSVIRTAEGKVDHSVVSAVLSTPEHQL